MEYEFTKSSRFNLMHRFTSIPEVGTIVYLKNHPFRVVTTGVTYNPKVKYVSEYILVIDEVSGQFRPVWAEYFFNHYKTQYIPPFCEYDPEYLKKAS